MRIRRPAGQPRRSRQSAQRLRYAYPEFLADRPAAILSPAAFTRRWRGVVCAAAVTLRSSHYVESPTEETVHGPSERHRDPACDMATGEVDLAAAREVD